MACLNCIQQKTDEIINVVNKVNEHENDIVRRTFYPLDKRKVAKALVKIMNSKCSNPMCGVDNGV